MAGELLTFFARWVVLLVAVGVVAKYGDDVGPSRRARLGVAVDAGGGEVSSGSILDGLRLTEVSLRSLYISFLTLASMRSAKQGEEGDCRLCR